MTTIEEYEEFLAAMRVEDAKHNLLRLGEYLRFNDTFFIFIEMSAKNEQAADSLGVEIADEGSFR